MILIIQEKQKRYAIIRGKNKQLLISFYQKISLFEDGLLKMELLQLVRQNKNKYDKYAVDELAKAD